MSLPYYKRYPRDFFEGTAGMSGEVKCAYALLLDIIYIHRGKLPDDPHYISGQLGYSVRKWNIIKKELVSRGKIASVDNIISNKRADKEEIILSKYQDNQRKNGSQPNKNKGLIEATALQPEPEPEIYTNNPTTIDDRSKVDNDLNGGVGWFSDAEISRLSEEHNLQELRSKLRDDKFKKWCEDKLPANPKLCATRWIKKQADAKAADNRLTEIHSNKGPFKVSESLLATLPKMGGVQ